ncbi:hypothetical protein BSR04_12045, partial [Serratia plymuthica]
SIPSNWRYNCAAIIIIFIITFIIYTIIFIHFDRLLAGFLFLDAPILSFNRIFCQEIITHRYHYPN